jgi:hypothetical protein
MTEAGAQTFRPLDRSGRLDDGYVNPYYPPDLKRRVVGASVRARSVRRRGAGHGRSVPALGGAAQRHDAGVSARWVMLRRHERHRPQVGASKALPAYPVDEQDLEYRSVSNPDEISAG